MRELTGFVSIKYIYSWYKFEGTWAYFLTSLIFPTVFMGPRVRTANGNSYIKCLNIKSYKSSYILFNTVCSVLLPQQMYFHNNLEGQVWILNSSTCVITLLGYEGMGKCGPSPSLQLITLSSQLQLHPSWCMWTSQLACSNRPRFPANTAHWAQGGT